MNNPVVSDPPVEDTGKASVGDLKERVRAFLIENYLFKRNEFRLEDDTSLLEAGIVDSTGVLELILFLEETFQIEVLDDEAVPDNLDSITRITNFVEHKRQ